MQWSRHPIIPLIHCGISSPLLHLRPTRWIGSRHPIGPLLASPMQQWSGVQWSRTNHAVRQPIAVQHGATGRPRDGSSSWRQDQATQAARPGDPARSHPPLFDSTRRRSSTLLHSIRPSPLDTAPTSTRYSQAPPYFCGLATQVARISHPPRPGHLLVRSSFAPPPSHLHLRHPL